MYRVLVVGGVVKLKTNTRRFALIATGNMKERRINLVRHAEERGKSLAHVVKVQAMQNVRNVRAKGRQSVISAMVMD